MRWCRPSAPSRPSVDSEGQKPEASSSSGHVADKALGRQPAMGADGQVPGGGGNPFLDLALGKVIFQVDGMEHAFRVLSLVTLPCSLKLPHGTVSPHDEAIA